MMDSLLKRIEKNRKAHIRWLAMVLCLSMIVSLGTFAGFHKTAVAKTYTKEVLDCPYAQEGASPVAHVHNDDCYDGDTLVCTLPEREAHTHTEECFAEQRRLTCVLEENPGHQHGDACYAAREENVCGLEENPGHVHNGTCFNESGVLICTMAEGEGAHTHTADCFTTVYDLICDIPAGEGAHTHTDECYTTERVQVCGQEELPVHVHGPECIRTVEWNEGEDEPVVTDEPAESTVPEMPVSDPDADLESAEDWNREFENLELSGNWARDLILVAATQQGKGESPNNFEAFLNDAGDAWVRYGYTRYGAWYGVPYANEWSAMFVSFCLRYAGIPEENVPNNPTAAFMAESFQKGELFAGRDYVPVVGDLIFFDTVVDDDIVNIDHMGIVFHVDAEDGTINTVEGDRTDAVATFGYHLDDEQIVGYGILPQNPNYNYEEEITDDETDGLIVMTEEEEKNEESADTDEATVPSVPMPAQSWERTAGGIKVTVDAPEGAFPENTTIAVTPVNGNRLKDTVSDAVSGEVLEVQAVDITFFDAEDHEIEPAIPIRVSMTPAATEHAEEKTSVVHVDIAQQTAELVEQAAGTEFDNSEVVFDADAFTIYAIVYSVDFEYEVDGKTYEASFPGAQDIALQTVLKELGVCYDSEKVYANAYEQDEAVAEFVSKISSVASTNEEIVRVTAEDGYIIRVLRDGDAQIVVTMQDGAVFSIDVKAEGVTEVETEDKTAVISTVGDLYLPEEAEAKAEVVEGADAIAAVEETVGAAADVAYQVFDISLENVEAGDFDGFQVEVQLPTNVNGKDFRLYHIHDGEVTDITDSLITKGTMDENGVKNVSGFTFETENFSEFVLSYTVDFYYGEYEFHLPGSGEITLSQLVELLNIIEGSHYESVSHFIEAVEKVDFSDESLVMITQIEGDWLLQSLVPFTSEETLIITMKDNSVYVIRVTDAQGDLNLNNLISNVEISDTGTTVENNGTVVVGRTYKFHFEFSEIGDKQIGTNGTLTYTVPEGIDLTQLSGSFDIKYSGRTYSGNTYTYAPTTRQITVTFSDTVKSLIDKSGDAKFNIDIDGQFTGEKTHFDFGGGINRDYTMDTTNSVDIDKTGYYSSADNKVHYTVTAKSNGKSENVVVTDAITGTALTLDADSIKINGLAPAAGVVSSSAAGFTANLGTLNDKEIVTITYTASVNFDNLTGKGTVQETGNKVKIVSDGDPDGKEKPTNIANQIDYNPLQKSAGTATGEGNTKTLPWTITVNSQQLKSVAGATITDTNKSPDVMHYSGSGITIAVMDGDRVVRTIAQSWTDLGVEPATATGWSYKLPETSDDLNNAYKYVITYNTEVDASGKVSDFNVSNTVGDDDGHQGGGGGTVPPGDDKVTMHKDALASSNSVQSNWSISFDVPADGLSSAVLTDTFPNTYINGTHMIDALVADSISIDGLADGESYDIATSENQVVITFYKTGSKTQANQGLTGTGTKRTITVTLSTENNPAWVEAASGSAHTNTASLNVNGQVITDTAQTYPANEGIAKTGNYQGTMEIEGKNVPVFKYTITLYGISDESFDESGNLKSNITDKYASEWLELWEKNDDTDRKMRERYNSARGDSQVSHTDTSGVLTFSPKKTDFPTYKINGGTSDEQTMYYSLYQMDYWLKVKDNKLSGADGILMTSLNGGVELKNEVKWGNYDDDVTITYEYPVVDKEQTQNGSGHDGIVKYKVVLNPEKLTLNGGEAMEMQDNAQGITVDYSTIVIVAEDANGNDVSDQVNYYYRGYTGYYTIPDSTKVTITYSARIIGDGLVTYSNDVTMKGFRDSTKNTEDIHNSGAGNLNIDWVVVYKHEYQNMRRGLNGATYVLTDSEGNPVVYPETADASKGFVPGEPVLFTTKKTDLHALPDGTLLDGDGNVATPATHVPEERDGYAWIYLSKADTGMAFQKGVNYYFKEYSAPEGYQIASTIYSFIITEHPDYNNWEYYKGDILRLADKPVKGILEVHKTIEGAENLTDTQKKQITFTIKAKDTNGNPMTFPYKLDASDNPVYIDNAEAGLSISYADFVDGVYRLNNLPNGTYTVTETNVTLGGYTHTETTWKIEEGEATAIASGATSTPGENVTITDAENSTPATHKVTYKNKYEQQEARLTIVKKGESDSLYLYGATFQLSRWDDTTNDYVTASNTEFPYLNEKGEFTIDYANRKTGVTLTNLPAGRYRLVETKAPANYQLDNTPIYFTVGNEPERVVSNGNASGNNSDNQNLTFTAAAGDKPAQYAVKNLVAHTYTLTKIDSILVAKKLNGAEFTIAEVSDYSATSGFTYGSFSRELTTGENGQIIIDADAWGLKPNTVYIVYETQAPAGYELNRKLYAFWIGANERTIALYNRIAAAYNKDGADGISYVNLAEGPQVTNVPNVEKKMDLFVKKLWYGIKGTEWSNMPPTEWGITQIEVRLVQQTINTTDGTVISEAQYPDENTTFFLTPGGGGLANWLDYEWKDLPTGNSVNTSSPVKFQYYVEEIGNNDFQAYYTLTTTKDQNNPGFGGMKEDAKNIISDADHTNVAIVNLLKPLNYSVKKVWMDEGNQTHNNVNVKLYYIDSKGKRGDPTQLDLKNPVSGEQYQPNVNLSNDNNWSYTWGYIYPGELDNPRTYYVDETNLSNDYTCTVTGPNEAGLFVMTNTKTVSDKLKVKKVWLNEDGTEITDETVRNTLPENIMVHLQKEEGTAGTGYTVTIRKWTNYYQYSSSEDTIVVKGGSDLTITTPTWMTNTIYVGEVDDTSNPISDHQYKITNIQSDQTIDFWTEPNNGISFEYNGYSSPETTWSGEITDVTISDGIKKNGNPLTADDILVTLNSGNQWMYNWETLTAPEGKTYRYSVREFPVPAGYDVSYENNDGITTGIMFVKNTKSEYTRAIAYKKWLNADGTEMGSAPNEATVTFTLYQDRRRVKDVVLDGAIDDNGEDIAWTAVWEGLEVTNKRTGQPYNYTVKETSGFTGYAAYRIATDEESSASGLVEGPGSTKLIEGDTVSNGGTIYNKKARSLTVTKAWKNTQGDTLTDIPEGTTVTIALYKTGTAEAIKTVTLDGYPDVNGESTAWVANFSGLEDDATYVVKEEGAPSGFTLVSTKLNSQDPVTESVSAEVTLETGDNTVVYTNKKNEDQFGSLKLKKIVRVNEADNGTSTLTDGTYTFTIQKAGEETTGEQTAVHTVTITYVGGNITEAKLDSSTTLTADEDGFYEVKNLEPGDYVITETLSSDSKAVLSDVSGGKSDGNLTNRTITVTVVAGQEGATVVEAGKATFTNNVYTFEFTKIWKDLANANQEWVKNIMVTLHIPQTTGDVTSELEYQYTISKETDGTFTVNPGTSNPDNPTSPTGTVSGDKDNGYKVTFTGLTSNQRAYVTETKVDGYNSPSYMFMATDGKTLTPKNATNSPAQASNGEYIVNTPEGGYELPQTGGMGTGIFTAIGAILSGTAGAILTIRKRKQTA